MISKIKIFIISFFILIWLILSNYTFSIINYSETPVENISFWFYLQDFYSMYDSDWRIDRKWEIYRQCPSYSKDYIYSINIKKNKTTDESFINNCWIINSINWFVNFSLFIIFIYYLIQFIVSLISSYNPKKNWENIKENWSFNLFLHRSKKEIKIIIILFAIESWIIPIFINIILITANVFLSWIDLWFSEPFWQIYNQFLYWIKK